MALVVAFLFCVAFVELFVRLRLLADARAIMRVSRESLAVLTDRGLSDDDKEKLIRRRTVEMFKATFAFIAKFAGLCLMLYLLYLLVSGWSAPLGDELFAHFMSVPSLLALTLVTMGYVWVRNVVGK